MALETDPELIRVAERIVVLLPPSSVSPQGLGIRVHDGALETLMTDRTGENQECVTYSNLDWRGSKRVGSGVIEAVTISILLREIGALGLVLHDMLKEAKRTAYEELGVDLDAAED